MKLLKFHVTVDYLTCANIDVLAPDELAAKDFVRKYLATERGQGDMLRRMAEKPNVPDGFDIAAIEQDATYNREVRRCFTR